MMKSTNWGKTTPTLIFFFGTLAAVLIRGREDPQLLLDLSLLILVPILLFFTIAYWVVEMRSRARSERIWQVMEQRHPNQVKYLFHVFPQTRTDLDRLGLWTKPPIVTTPVLGVVFGPAVTIWEEGNAGWSLSLASSNIEAVELGGTENSARTWPAVRLLLIDEQPSTGNTGAVDGPPQRGELVLALRHRRHKRLSQMERTRLVRELNSNLVSKRLV